MDAPSTPKSTRWPKVGDVNVLEGSLGNRGEGKSTHQAMRTYELQREFGGAYVIGHSFGRRMPRKLPDGVYGGDTLPIRYYRSIPELHRGLTRNPQAWHFLAPPMDDEDPHPELAKSSADELLRYAVRLSHAIRWNAWKRAHPMTWAAISDREPRNGVDFAGLECPPIIVCVDEGIAVGGAAGGDGARKDENKWFNEMLISLRHLHIALQWSIQDPTMKSWRVMGQASCVHVFYLQHAWALDAIRAAGATPEQLAEITRLDPFEHVTLTFGRDRVKKGTPATAASVEKGAGVEKP